MPNISVHLYHPSLLDLQQTTNYSFPTTVSIHSLTPIPLTMYAKIALFLASAAIAQAQTADQLAELNVIMADVKDHLSDYMGLATSGTISISDLPAGVMPLAMAVQSATDDSYTTLYSNVDFAAVDTFLTKLPWYSSRLQPALESAKGADAATSAAESSAASSAAVESSAASSAAASSSKITSAPSAEATGATTATAYSFHNTTVTVCEATSCHVTYVTETVCNHPEICSHTVTETVCTHPEVCGYKNGTTAAGNNGNNGAGKTTAGVSQQTANGAAKAFMGLGAGAVAAAALLL